MIANDLKKSHMNLMMKQHPDKNPIIRRKQKLCLNKSVNHMMYVSLPFSISLYDVFTVNCSNSYDVNS